MASSDTQFPDPPASTAPPPALARDPDARRRRVLQAWFYLGVPLLLGFLLGWLRVGRAAEWPRDVALVYWIGVAVLSTGLLAAATAVLALALRRLRVPLWLTLLAGQVVGGALLVDPALVAYRALLRAILMPGLVEPASGGLGELLQRLPSNALLWIGLNLLFFHVLRLPRFGYLPPADTAAASPAIAPDRPGEPVAGANGMPGPPAAAAATDPAGAQSFMDRVRPERRGSLLALEADGHYLRVHTDAGSDLVLYRLSDAMRELGPQAGAQVHRSWWVAADALSGERRRDSLKLVNGLEVPVSRSYRLAVRERGWLRDSGDS
jgi:hypothetical protein